MHPHSEEACTADVRAVKDALYVLNGKWKLPLILTLSKGAMRFNELQKSLGDITPKILSNELRELEINEFVERKIISTRPVTITYELTPYSDTLHKVLDELRNWGLQHRKRIVESRKQSNVPEEI